MSGVGGPQSPGQAAQGPYQYPGAPGYGTPGPAPGPAYGTPASYGGPTYGQPAYGAPPPAMHWQPVPSETDPGLDKPWYGIGFLPAYARFWKKYATFSGRASRGEYWWAQLGHIVVSMVFYALLVVTLFTTQAPCTQAEIDAYQCTSDISPASAGVLVALIGYVVAMLIPGLAISWRRLHDTGRSGVYYLLSFIPYVGSFILLIMFAGKTSPDGARYDDPPRAPYDQPSYGP